MNKQQTIRTIYKERLPIIIKEYPSYDAYLATPIHEWFTKIEENVWHDIRVVGLPFHPQFPVEGYFIDFADPVKKIGIEVDGKEYHKDFKKDKKRRIPKPHCSLVYGGSFLEV